MRSFVGQKIISRSTYVNPSISAAGVLIHEHPVIQEKREEILHMAAKHGAQTVRVFGSVARGEADVASDLDLLVEMEPGRSLLDLGGLLMELQDLLGCRVDERIRDRVLKEAVAL